MVGVAGFEPATPCSRSRCASRAALHPVQTRQAKATSPNGPIALYNGRGDWIRTSDLFHPKEAR